MIYGPKVRFITLLSAINIDMIYQITLLLCIILWVVRVYHFITPTNVLNEIKYIDIGFIDFIVSPIIGLILLIFIINKKQLIKSKSIY